MCTQRGFVLFAVLIFMQIYALLGMAALLSVRLADKTTQAMDVRHQMQLQANAILHGVEQSLLLSQPGCIMEPMPIAQLLHEPPSWWAENACQSGDEDTPTYYTVEKLALDTCASVQNNQNQPVAAQYYRITLSTFYGKADKILLQSTVVVPAVQVVECAEQAHKVQGGRQMVREL